MNDQRDELLKAIGMDISRRTMLKRMSYGMAGAALAPPLLANAQGRPKSSAVALSDYTPQPVWSYTPPRPLFLLNDPVFVNGTIIVNVSDQYYYGQANYQSFLYCVDAQTRHLRWSHSYNTSFTTPVVADGIIYVTDDAGSAGSLYSIDSTTGRTRWQKPYQVANDLLLTGSKLIFATFDGHIHALDLAGNQLWSYFAGEAVAATRGGASQAVIAGGAVLVLINETLHAVSLQTGNFLWKYSGGVATGAALSVGSGNAYYIAGNQLYAVDVATGQLKWKWPSGAAQSNLSAPAYYNEAVYLGDAGGRFSAVDPNSGALLWQAFVQNDISTATIFIEDGIAYFATYFSPNSTTVAPRIYALDLPSKGQEVVSFNPPTAAASLVSVETGICYYNDINSIGAVNMAGLLHQFFCESELIVEDYLQNTSTGAAQGNTTSFRTHVQLFDPNKNPRVNKSVKVWASAPVTITSGGQSFDIDTAATGKSAWLQTDAAGELSIVTKAAGISTPSLYLWGNFMELDEAIVIYPDHDALNTLANVQGSHLATATTYDGSQMLPATYTQTDDLAATIRNTIGGTAAAMQQTRERHGKVAAIKRLRKRQRGLAAATATSYLAYPESTPNIVYQPVAGPAERKYVAGAAPRWTAKFNATGGVTFSSGTLAAPQLPPGSIFDDFAGFVEKVVNGAGKVAQIVWDDVQTIYDELGNAYQFVVNTVERAVAVVTGILKTVIDDIKKAIEWLSYLFEWGDILATKDQLKAAALQGFTNLQTWVDHQIASGLSAVHTFFQNIEQTIAADLTSANNLIGGSSLQSRQPNGNNPQSVYGMGGAKSYTKSRWLIQKFQDNAAQASVGSATALGGIADPIVAAVEQLYAEVSKVISSPQFQSLPADIKNVFTDFSLLATNPSEFVTKSFGDIIRLISNVVVSLIKFIDVIAESLLRTLQAIIDALIGLVNRPLNIPVLSDLYSLITGGSQLTILDLCCLLVAVPTTIVSKALNAGAVQADGSRAAQLGAVPIQQVGLLLALAVYTIIDPVMDLEPEPPLPLKLGYLALNLVIQGLNFPSDLASNTTGTYIFYAATAVPLVMSAVDVGATGTFQSTWEIFSPFIATVYGAVMLGVSIKLGVTDPEFRGSNYLLMVQNIFTFIPFIPKPAKLAGEDGRIVLGVIDVVSDLAATILEGVQLGQG